jgi:hypothetical protein
LRSTADPPTTRLPVAGLPYELPLTGLAVARAAFFGAPGQKTNAFEPARRLLARMHKDVHVDARLAEWHSLGRTIEEPRWTA